MVGMLGLSKRTCCFVGKESLKDAADCCDEAEIRQEGEGRNKVVVAFLCGSDVFAVVPTGFRRSLLCLLLSSC